MCVISIRGIPLYQPEQEQINQLADSLSKLIQEIYLSDRIFPVSSTGLERVSETPLPLKEIEQIWKTIVDESTHLTSPSMFGHMDTLVHPVAPFTDALVSALNNNPLWREISPYASKLEETLLAQLGDWMGLGTDHHGIFCSGGSLANLNCLFAACGGFTSSKPRSEFVMIYSEGAHASIGKAASILGFSKDQIEIVKCGNDGQISLQSLCEALDRHQDKTPVVTAITGSTFHGAIDPVKEVSDLVESRNGWLHIDAVYGGGLGVSPKLRSLLAGIEKANSVAMAPQKWMYVPRLSAVAYIRGRKAYEEALHWPMAYSVGTNDHRGAWGIQGSRRADVLTLWATLNAIGTKELAKTIENQVEITGELYNRLKSSEMLVPLHEPELNIQLFTLKPEIKSELSVQEIHQELIARNDGWVSLAKWREEDVFRAVILNPRTNYHHLEQFVIRMEERVEEALNTNSDLQQT